MKKLPSPRKAAQSLIFLTSLSSLAIPQCLASPLYEEYLELGLAYNLRAPDSVVDLGNAHTEPLYTGSNISYQIEAGISVPLDHNNSLKIGIFWYDLLNQSESKGKHRPYKLEIFSEQVWNFQKSYFLSVGVGYKLAEQTEINYEYNGYRRTLYVGTNPVTDKISARFSVGKEYGNYTVSLDHHSQWLKGKPFNDKWEYHVTYVGVSYSF